MRRLARCPGYRPMTSARRFGDPRPFHLSFMGFGSTPRLATTVLAVICGVGTVSGFMPQLFPLVVSQTRCCCGCLYPGVVLGGEDIHSAT